MTRGAGGHVWVNAAASGPPESSLGVGADGKRPEIA